jgi:hypothetical protein
MFAAACAQLRLSFSLLTTFLDPLSQKSTVKWHIQLCLRDDRSGRKGEEDMN